jgi:hypothetical protein
LDFTTILPASMALAMVQPDVVFQIPVDLLRGELQVGWKGGVVVANQIPRALSHRGSEGGPAVADLNPVLAPVGWVD